MSAILSVLQNTFKLNQFRPGQEAVINTLLEGRSALAVFPTGGGKSLCYQLPALLLQGLTLVVSPLIALMKDQVDALTRLGVAAARLDSSQSHAEVQGIYQAIRHGEIKLLYVAPERLKNERFIQRLQGIRISLLAIDEAHCISEWGHNFRPDYLKLADVAQDLKAERILALTATATPSVAQDICRQFSIVPTDHVQTSFHRANLQLCVTPCDAGERQALLLERLSQSESSASTIVYVTLQNTAEQVAAYLAEHGLSAVFYHAGMKEEDRHRVQNQFMAGEARIVVATIAFGMGIDKSNIRAVYHYNLPKSIENYVQEIGRAGRDGKASYCELFACAEDIRVLENFIYGDTPTTESLRGLLTELLSGEEVFDISTYHLSHAFDIRPLVLNTTLTYLELAGSVSATNAFYTEYKLHFLRSAEDIISTFSGERADFIRALFAAGKLGRKWLTLDMPRVEALLQQPAHRIQKAIDYFSEQGWLEVSVANLRQGYRRLQNVDIEALLEQFIALFERREQQDIARIHQVISYVNNPQCLTLQLLEYFGEQAHTPCGTCSHCTQVESQALASAMDRPLMEKHHQIISALEEEHHSALAQPRQLARFLCGLPSPATARGRLRAHPAYGALADYSFGDVLNVVSE